MVQFRRHLGKHLEQLALSALPILDTGGASDSENVDLSDDSDGTLEVDVPAITIPYHNVSTQHESNSADVVCVFCKEEVVDNYAGFIMGYGPIVFSCGHSAHNDCLVRDTPGVFSTLCPECDGFLQLPHREFEPSKFLSRQLEIGDEANLIH
jgi:hypothetical protein